MTTEVRVRDGGCGGTYSVLGELRDVVEDQLVGVALLVELLLVGVGHDATDDLSDGVVELRVTTELLPLLGILMLICHCIYYL